MSAALSPSLTPAIWTRTVPSIPGNGVGASRKQTDPVQPSDDELVEISWVNFSHIYPLSAWSSFHSILNSSAGAYAPDCDVQGFYKPTQCHNSVGVCWCVDKHGVEFANTRTRGKPNCGNYEATFTIYHP